MMIFFFPNILLLTIRFFPAILFLSDKIEENVDTNLNFNKLSWFLSIKLWFLSCEIDRRWNIVSDILLRTKINDSPHYRDDKLYKLPKLQKKKRMFFLQITSACFLTGIKHFMLKMKFKYAKKKMQITNVCSLIRIPPLIKSKHFKQIFSTIFSRTSFWNNVHQVR